MGQRIQPVGNWHPVGGGNGRIFEDEDEDEEEYFALDAEEFIEWYLKQCEPEFRRWWQIRQLSAVAVNQPH